MSTTRTIIATASAVDGPDAVETVRQVAARVPGLAVSGRWSERSARHLLWNVEVEVAPETNVNDAWVVLTSYGISPSKDLGSRWEAVLGASA